MGKTSVSNYPFNKASIRVIEDLWFIEEGILRRRPIIDWGTCWQNRLFDY